MSVRLCSRHRSFFLTQIFSSTLNNIEHVEPRRLLNLRVCLKHTKVAAAPNKYLAIYRDFHGHIQDEQAAKDFLFAIESKERTLLLQGLMEFEDSANAGEGVHPSVEQLRLVLLHNALPFIGFGFLDNFLMIVAGEYIDTMFGAMLGISTMAAAGLGNLVSDVAGVGSASYVESLTAKVGVKAPALTPQQVVMKKTKRYANFGKALGVAIGCFVGMFPLLLFKNKPRAEGQTKETGVGLTTITSISPAATDSTTEKTTKLTPMSSV